MGVRINDSDKGDGDRAPKPRRWSACSLMLTVFVGVVVGVVGLL